MLMQAMLDKKKLQQTGPAGGQAGLAKTGAAVQQGPANYSGGVKPLQGPQTPQPGTGGSPLAALAAKYAGGMGGAKPPVVGPQGGGQRNTGQPIGNTPGVGGGPGLGGGLPYGRPAAAPVPPSGPAPVMPAPQMQMANPGPQASMPTPQDVWNKLKGIPQAAGQGAQDVANNVAGAVQGAMPDMQGFDLNSFNPLKLLQMWGLMPGDIDISGGMFGGMGGFPGGGGGGGGPAPTRPTGPTFADGTGGNSTLPTSYDIMGGDSSAGHGPAYVSDVRPGKTVRTNNFMGSYGMPAVTAGTMETAAGSPSPTLENQRTPNKNLSEGGAGTVGGNAQGQTAGPSEDDMAKLLARFQGDTVTPTGVHGNIAARDAGAGANAANMPDTVYPNAKGGPLGEMADWMTSGDINRLKNNIGSFNDLNAEANTALKDNMRDFGMAGNIGNWSRDAARESANRQIDRGQQQSLRDLAAREARGGVSGTGARQGIAQAGINAQKDAELALNDRTFNDEMQRMGMLGNARNAYANQMSAGSRVDMENLLNNYTSNKELFGQMMGFIPDLIGNIIPF